LPQRLKLNPQEEIITRIELAKKFLDEAKKYISQNDSVQASEKLYKVAEECIKALAIKFKVSEAEEAKKEGRWWTRLLARVAGRLAMLLNEINF